MDLKDFIKDCTHVGTQPTFHAAVGHVLSFYDSQYSDFSYEFVKVACDEKVYHYVKADGITLGVIGIAFDYDVYVPTDIIVEEKPKDYLLFCVGECNDALRDREFFLVRSATSEREAYDKLAKYFLRENTFAEGISAEEVAYEEYAPFIVGENLKDGLAGQTHYAYAMYEVE